MEAGVRYIPRNDGQAADNREWARRFREAAAAIMTRSPTNVDPRLVKAHADGMLSQADELEAGADEYDRLKKDVPADWLRLVMDSIFGDEE
jgi:hypothetical protein